MSANTTNSSNVANFRQVLLWPVQLVTDDNELETQKYWEYLKSSSANTSWHEIEDEFTSSGKQLSESSYHEFVSFMPFAQRFLYGEGKHSTGYGESPIHIFSRSDIAQVRITIEHNQAPITLQVAHTELYFFFDVDVAILVIEVVGKAIELPNAMEVLYRLGRTYPNEWDENGDGKHCAKLVEWLGRDGQVLSVSDYENKKRYLEFVKEHNVTCVSKHWEYLMQPLVQHSSNAEGRIRYREIEYQRMPLMSYLAFDNVQQLSRGDMIRLGLGAGYGDSHTLPYSEKFLANFEQNHCYDRYWDGTMQDSSHTTRLMCTGQSFTVLGSNQNSFFTNDKTGIKNNFKKQYFLLYLIAHFQKAALLMLSDRLVQAISRLDINSPDSIKTFRLSIRHTTETFLRFTHRYWFQSVSDQVVARDIFTMMHAQLKINDLFEITHRRIMDMAEYLEAEEIRRQADTVVRLTVVTILGLVGTMTSGLLGMNIFSLAEASVSQKLVYFVSIFIPVGALTFYTVIKSRRLSLFLDALSDEKMKPLKKLLMLKNVWSGNLHE
jgi:hypothetical protein